MKLELKRDPRGSRGRTWGVWRDGEKWLGNLSKRDAQGYIDRIEQIKREAAVRRYALRKLSEKAKRQGSARRKCRRVRRKTT